MKYEDIRKEQEERNGKEPMLKVPRGRLRLKGGQSNLPKSKQKPRDRVSEREDALREIEAAGLGDYYTVIEF
jgi:hypothetical protein